MDLNYGASNNVTPYNFTIPTGLGVGNGYDYSSLNSYGLGGTTGTMGANTNPLAGLGGNTGSSSLGGFGMNLPTLQLGLQGIGSLASLYTGLKALGLARDQFDYNKQITTANLNNSVKSYNTALSDKATARGVAEGQSSQQVADYINQNKLSS